MLCVFLTIVGAWWGRGRPVVSNTSPHNYRTVLVRRIYAILVGVVKILCGIIFIFGSTLLDVHFGVVGDLSVTRVRTIEELGRGRCWRIQDRLCNFRGESRADRSFGERSDQAARENGRMGIRSGVVRPA